jgi:hypothetical protein
MFLKTFNQTGLSRATLHPRDPFHGIVPGEAVTPIYQITVPMTFRT